MEEEKKKKKKKKEEEKKKKLTMKVMNKTKITTLITLP